MAQSKSGGNQTNKQSATEAEAQGGKDADKKSSKNHMADVKAGTGKGAGGGAKQKQKR